MSIEEFLKDRLKGKFIQGYEVIEVIGFYPWEWEADYISDRGISVECRVKVPDARTKLGYRLDTKSFEIYENIEI